ncbi:MAG: aminodeoxychorismate lyase [Gammaproteobacteria bacterium]
MSASRIIVNGTAVDSVSALDRGLQYGDGLFETLAILDGTPQHWDSHIERLERGCSRLYLPSPQRDGFLADAKRLCQGVKRGVLKIILTRGAGGRGYRPSSSGSPTRVVVGFPWPELPPQAATEGVTVRLCDTRLGLNPALAGIKHLNRLEQVLAQREWAEPDIAEGLMRDLEGNVIEGTMSNLFIVLDGRLMTPDLNRCGVAGIMRAFILGTAQELGIEVVIAPLGVADLQRATEAFLCNSLIGLWPLRGVVGLNMSFHRDRAVTAKVRSALVNKGILPQ